MHIFTIKSRQEFIDIQNTCLNSLKSNNIVLLYKEITDKEIIASVKKAWTEETGKKVGDMETLTVYVKAEEAAAYYVVNDTETGKVEF